MMRSMARPALPRAFTKALAGASVLLLLAACGPTQAPGGAGDGTAAADPPGKQTYDRFCTSCHSMGAAGAPRVGDTAAWAPRIAKGMDALVASAVHGKPPGMPPKGLCVSCTEADLRDAVAYIVERSR